MNFINQKRPISACGFENQEEPKKKQRITFVPEVSSATHRLAQATLPNMLTPQNFTPLPRIPMINSTSSSLQTDKEANPPIPAIVLNSHFELNSSIPTKSVKGKSKKASPKVHQPDHKQICEPWQSAGKLSQLKTSVPPKITQKTHLEENNSYTNQVQNAFKLCFLAEIFNKYTYGTSDNYKNLTTLTSVTYIHEDILSNKSNSLTYINGGRYEGNLVYGTPQGQGVLYYPDGSVYAGNFKNGLPEGPGAFIEVSGKQHLI